jgi:hypothetical protein
MEPDLITEVACCECGKSVRLTAAHTNERGQAIHPDY